MRILMISLTIAAMLTAVSSATAYVTYQQTSAFDKCVVKHKIDRGDWIHTWNRYDYRMVCQARVEADEIYKAYKELYGK